MQQLWRSQSFIPLLPHVGKLFEGDPIPYMLVLGLLRRDGGEA